MAAPLEGPEPGYLVGGRYELIEVAGRGGMAVVWRAVVRGDAGFTRTVAVKQINPHLVEQQLYVDMFIEEARVGAQLVDANVAQTYDFFHQDGLYYLVMEWVEGIDLGSLIRYEAQQSRKVSWPLASAIGVGLLRGLSAAHERNLEGKDDPIVHRDISPHNILITEKGNVKVIDFGLAYASDRTAELTDPGIVKGKMSYLSPEVLRGRRGTPASDQFACGTVLWELLVGRKLFDAPTDFETYRLVRDGRVQPLRPLRPDIPKELINAIQRALEIDPDDRYPSVRDMARELAKVLRTRPGAKDLHRVLGKRVAEARQTMGLGRRTGDPTTHTPVAEVAIAKPAADINETPATAPVEEEKQGLWHRLPFLRKKTS